MNGLNDAITEECGFLPTKSASACSLSQADKVRNCFLRKSALRE